MEFLLTCHLGRDIFKMIHLDKSFALLLWSTGDCQRYRQTTTTKNHAWITKSIAGRCPHANASVCRTSPVFWLSQKFFFPQTFRFKIFFFLLKKRESVSGKTAPGGSRNSKTVRPFLPCKVSVTWPNVWTNRIQFRFSSSVTLELNVTCRFLSNWIIFHQMGMLLRSRDLRFRLIGRVRECRVERKSLKVYSAFLAL